MKDFTVELPGELLELLGSEEEAKRDAKIAVVLDLVRRSRISRAKAAELLGLALWDLPELLAQYRIPWFDYSPDDVERDLEAVGADLLVIDDAAARRIAEAEGQRVVGLPGLLIYAKHCGLVTEVRPMRDDMLASGFFLDEARYHSILRRAGE